MAYAFLDNYEFTAPTCVAIGIFDGVHLGHRHVLLRTRESAEAQGLTPVALTFDPHPLQLVAPERAPFSLCSLSQRVEWMTEPGLAAKAVIAHFDWEFAGLSARQFVEQVLVDKLHAREVRVGADFRFGKGRQGSVMDLESLGDFFGFAVTIVHTVALAGDRISSTGVRNLVGRGDVEQAPGLLGRPFTLRGAVVHGKHLGREIGYPTANLEPEAARQLLPANGVYSGYAVIDRGRALIRAAISVGTNPTTDGDNESRKVEAYLMDGFESDIYGHEIDLRFASRIRDEARFDSLDALVAQMGRDIAQIEQSLEK